MFALLESLLLLIGDRVKATVPCIPFESSTFFYMPSGPDLTVVRSWYSGLIFIPALRPPWKSLLPSPLFFYHHIQTVDKSYSYSTSFILPCVIKLSSGIRYAAVSTIVIQSTRASVMANEDIQLRKRLSLLGTHAPIIRRDGRKMTSIINLLGTARGETLDILAEGTSLDQPDGDHCTIHDGRFLHVNPVQIILALVQEGLEEPGLFLTPESQSDEYDGP